MIKEVISIGKTIEQATEIKLNDDSKKAFIINSKEDIFIVILDINTKTQKLYQLKLSDNNTITPIINHIIQLKSGTIVLASNQGSLFSIKIIQKEQNIDFELKNYSINQKLNEYLTTKKSEQKNVENKELVNLLYKKDISFNSEIKFIEEYDTVIENQINDEVNEDKIKIKKTNGILVGIDKYLININEKIICENLKFTEFLSFENQIIELKINNKKIILKTKDNKSYITTLNYLLNSFKEQNLKLDIDNSIDIDDKIISFDQVYGTNNQYVVTTNSKIEYIESNQKIWSNKSKASIVSKPLIYDIDKDNKVEILFNNKKGEIFCLDQNGKIKWFYDNEQWNTNNLIRLESKDKNIITNADFFGNIYVFNSKGILDIELEPSSAIMLDYGLFDIDFNENKLLKGDLIETTKVSEKVIEIVKTSDNSIITISGNGEFSFITF